MENEPSSTPFVPPAVVSRLSLYLRELQQLMRNGEDRTSSTKLGSLLGFTDAQVRKDLAHFGQFGTPGLGYQCADLIHAIKEILGTNQPWPVAVVGMGNLGRALIGYGGFANQGFQIQVGFDVNPEMVGQSLEGIAVHHLDELSQVVEAERIKMAIIAVPAAAAQEVADRLVKAGIEGILNFAPVTISLPDSVSKVGVDVAIELEQLSYAIVTKSQNS